DAHDLLDSSSAPAPGLDGRVVGHHRHLPAADHSEPGDHAVCRQLVGEHVCEKAVLDERTGVEEHVEALARGELVLLAQLGQVAGAALERRFAQLPVSVAHRPLNSGSRFSKNASTPSFESSVIATLSSSWRRYSSAGAKSMSCCR